MSRGPRKPKGMPDEMWQEEGNERNGHASEAGGEDAINPLAAGRVLLAKGIEEGIDPPEELEPGVLIRGGVHWVYGPSGEGKSWVLLWLVVRALARGQRVLLFDTENGHRITSERLNLLGVDTRRVDELLHYHPFPSLTADPACAASYLALLDEVQPDLIGFDGLANLLGSSELEESSNDDIIKWATNYTRPARKRRITSVVLDHTGHNGDLPRGASRKKDESDVMWAVKATATFDRDTVGRLTLRRIKDREAWLPERVGFSVGGSPEGFVFRRSDGTIEEPDPESGLTNTERKTLDVLREDFVTTGATAAEWKRAVSKPPYKVSEPAFYRALRTLKSLSLVEHPDSGRDSKYYPKNGPDDSDPGGKRDSNFSRPESEDSPDYHSLSHHYRDRGDSESEPTHYHRYHHPFRGDSDDSGADTNAPRERRLSAEETERVKRLISEGMAPDWARAEVLGLEVAGD